MVDSMANKKIAYIDVETTGLDPKTCAIIQLSGILEINGEIAETFDFKIRPNPDQAIYTRALEVTSIKMKDVLGAEYTQFTAYEKFIYMLDGHINKYDPGDKFYFVGYNSQTFDTQFIREFMNAHDNPYYGSYFWHPSIDVMQLVAYAAVGQRNKFVDFKLGTVAKSFGIELDESRLHDALYDVELTREVFKLIQKEYPTK